MDSLKDKIHQNKSYIVLVIGGLLMAAYHMISTQFLLQDAKPHFNTHLAFALLLVFLDSFASSRGKEKYIVLLFAGLVLICTGYVQFNWIELEDRAYFNTLPDLAIGFVLILLVLEATRRDFGLILPVLTIFMVLYPFLGRMIPEPFTCQALNWKQTISNLVIGLDNGIYGVVLSTSANYIFLFIVFGGVLQSMGATKFFMLAAKLIASRMQGGAGMMSIMSSALVGSITGSAAANVAITGSFTIPYMKNVGYKPEQSGAIEAAASNGGQIMPPVMGIAAFGMAGITGIPYINIITMAVVPALLYFWTAGLYVYLRAGQLGIKGLPEDEETVDIKELLYAFPSFVTPFIVIITLLVMGKSVMYVAFWAIISCIVVSFLKKDKPTISHLIEGFVNGARAGAGIGACSACIGLIMATLTMSGLGVKLAAGIFAWSGGHLMLALVIIAAICILMGTGGPALTAYFIVSMFAAPALVKMGVGFEQAHFFTFFYAVFSFVTPPVAIAALIASKLAKASYFKTAVESTKVAFGGFIIPVMFVYAPVLLLQAQPMGSAIKDIIAAIFCLLFFEISFVGYFLTHCKPWERLLFAIGGVSMLLYIVVKLPLLLLFGAALLFLLGFFQIKRRSQPEKSLNMLSDEVP